ncbi:Calpain-2 catalytic subunit [Strongyloides ratti]|uniref:Calpain-2 catalytic subunit n=1 Tax=Strongyloides ratti TaxID=34506 RepID=A0A090MZ41_STRRB|nr:Calpain-2 catalytic subunit [Strongyloides ratti]CEF68274.1 Calpain-2 catalytic subunit [Strongyloides ratti]
MNCLSCCLSLDYKEGNSRNIDQGESVKVVTNQYSKMGNDVEEDFSKVELQPDQFNGLIGNIAGNFIRDKVGGGAGDILGGLAGNFLSGGGGNSGGNDFGNIIGGLIGGGGGNSGGNRDSGGNSGKGSSSNHGNNDLSNLLGDLLRNGLNNRGSDYDGNSGNSGNDNEKTRKRDKISSFIGDIFNGGSKKNDNNSNNTGFGSGGFNTNDLSMIINLINSVGGGGKGGLDVGNLIGSLIGGGGGNRGGFSGGGGNIKSNALRGGVVNLLGDLVGMAGHKFLNIDPATGKMIGSIAGNILFDLGGKDNSLSNIGKIVLDNIISGNYKRDVDPYVPPSPRGGGSAPSPYDSAGGIDFYAERDRCLEQKILFEDPEFLAEDSSLFFSKRPDKKVDWLRPGEIVKDPQLIINNQSRFDVIQGELGDCWLLAAAACLTLRDELFYRVVPPDQSFTDNYAGIFHFQFWHYGRWVDVVIDDRLPTHNGELLYMHSKDNNEFWSALLEKAYAKLHGSYESLKGGTTSEALEDFTGGLTEFVDINNPPKNLLQMIMTGFELGSLFGCSIEADPYSWEARLPNGLIKGHAYSITACRMVNGPGGQTCILRIRNPWGNESEWNGAWSDGSSEWDYVGESQRREMGLKFETDGEFWMSFDDFMRNFEKMEICNLGPDVMDEIASMTGVQTSTPKWSPIVHEGQWIANETAGGCRNYLRTFPLNPQYRIQLTDSDPDDDDDLCTVIVAVMQKYRRELRHKGLDNLAIGFAIYDAGRIDGRLSQDFFAANKSCARSPSFINLREMTARFRVPPGNYVIVPSTFEPNEEASFMLRVFTNGFIESEEL